MVVVYQNVILNTQRQGNSSIYKVNFNHFHRKTKLQFSFTGVNGTLDSLNMFIWPSFNLSSIIERFFIKLPDICKWA